MKKSLSCLKKSMEKDGFPNVYTTALMAYVFTLAGDTETRARLLNQLNMEAKTKGRGLSKLGGAETQSMPFSVCVCVCVCA